ncbi:hypothetical protein ACE939_05075 [Aquimarina sp. W85]|uniref:hypothetical protein n=1 Tax=Aquimarina rhodophyticola TaxID=3342246 RepID=UPI003672DC33
MTFSERLLLVKDLVDQKKYSKEMIIQYMVDEKIHHSIAVIILAKIYKLNQEDAEKIIYNNKYYAEYDSENNPFNKEYL